MFFIAVSDSENTIRGHLTGNYVYGSDNRIIISFTGNEKGDELKEFKIEEAKGKFASFQNKIGTLDDILLMIEETKGEVGEVAYSNNNALNIVILDKNMRVRCINLVKGAHFGAGEMSDREFLQEFVNAYHIPNIKPGREENLFTRGYHNEWSYRDLSQGWGVTYSDEFGGHISLIPIVTQSKFD